MPIISNMPNIAERLKKINENIAAACERSGRSVDEVKTVVVTKTAPVESIKEVILHGYTHFGENRVQHLKQVAKEIAAFLEEQKDNPDIPDSVNWHMIGHLQRNKVRQ